VLSDALVAELGDSEILVSCLQPGLVKSGLHHRWEIAPEGASGAGYPLEPEDFARMVLFILEQSADRRRPEGSVESSEATVDEESGDRPLDESLEELSEEGRDAESDEKDDSAEEGFVQDEI
jgi:hypothetical protein